MIRIFVIVYLCLQFFPAASQDVYQRNLAADITHYVFSLSLNDESNEILGESLLTVNFTNSVKEFSIDLIGKSGLYGMEVTGVFEDNLPVNYEFTDDKIRIPLEPEGAITRTFKIQYHGIPEKGLVIDTTKFGNRSFFGDNWPNLARHWLPCVDHPYDKASVEFRVTAPEHYDVVATGMKIEESNLGNGNKRTIYYEPAPVAMKVATIGVTRFATKLLGVAGEVPVSAWVYPENRLEGFSDYAVSVKVMNYFIENIGPYPFAKLANMQAKTQWGGLENAGTIAYNENSVTGRNTVEGLIAHEIAHQWFGNSATEDSWNHVWLSEGFATYFTILYLEAVYGNEKRKEELVKDKAKIIEYYQKNPSPVVDNTIKDPLKVLSANTYQKGGWVLNMLRHELGDEIFWNGIREYYKTFRDSNALTIDFRKVMEKVSERELTDFFHQWIFTKGYPVLSWSWEFEKDKVSINIEQVQDHHIFTFPMDIKLLIDGQELIETVQITRKTNSIDLIVNKRPDEVILDPELWLLFDKK